MKVLLIACGGEIAKLEDIGVTFPFVTNQHLIAFGDIFDIIGENCIEIGVSALLVVSDSSLLANAILSI